MYYIVKKKMARPKTVFGGHLEFRCHLIFWNLVIFFLFFFHIKIYKIHAKHNIKSLMAYGMTHALLANSVDFWKIIFLKTVFSEKKICK
jgi:type IV secretory pathway TrbL component